MVALATVASLVVAAANTTGFPVAEAGVGILAATALFIASQHHALKLPGGRVDLVGLVPVSLVMLAVLFVARDVGGENSGWALIWVSLCTVGLIIGRFGWHAIVRSINGGSPLRRIAVLPSGTESLAVCRLLEAHFQNIGGASAQIFGDQATLASDSDPRATNDGLQDAVQRGLVDDIVVVRSKHAAPQADRLEAGSCKFPVNVWSVEHCEVTGINKLSEGQDGDYRLTSVKRPRINEGDILLKKFADVIFGAILLVILAPLMVVIAIGIKLSSRGPVFFRQERTGLHQRPFRILKFRSLRETEKDVLSLKQAKLDDPRITPIGRFLRKTCLDELPQLINVCRGEMALVGPRPHAPMTRVDGDLFPDVVADYDLRHCVRPGVTGLAQVSGYRGPVDDRELLAGRVSCDLNYIENWSLGLDVMILLRTLGVPFKAPPKTSETQSRA